MISSRTGTGTGTGTGGGGGVWVAKQLWSDPFCLMVGGAFRRTFGFSDFRIPRNFGPDEDASPVALVSDSISFRIAFRFGQHFVPPNNPKAVQENLRRLLNFSSCHFSATISTPFRRQYNLGLAG